ncbi:MAG: hypothetical protein PHF79_02810 [Candidatus Pacebacteria bacterium]|nr:hypothetical protein [Candidatus Paceibacterota bacterium]
MKLNPKNSSGLFILVAVLVVAAAIGYFLIFSKVRSVSEENAVLAAQVSQLSQSNEHVQALKSVVDQSQGYLDRLNSYFVGSGDQNTLQFITQIESLATSVGLQHATQNITLDNGNGLDALGKQSIGVTFATSGSWSETVRFISLLESSPYILDITRIDLDKSASGAGITGATSTSPKSQNIWTATYHFSVVKMQ